MRTSQIWRSSFFIVLNRLLWLFDPFLVVFTDNTVSLKMNVKS